MANIFTRKALNDILANDQLTAEQKTEQVFALYGRALDDGYIAKAAAKLAQDTALEQAKADWEKGQTVPDPKESDEYKALLGDFDAYKAMQAARTSKDFEGVKPKFFEQVYGMVDRGDGAKPLREQLAGIRERFEEYFVEPASSVGDDPSAPFGGTSPFRGGWGEGGFGGGVPAVVLPTGNPPAPSAGITLGEAMRRANAGEAVDISQIGK